MRTQWPGLSGHDELESPDTTASALVALLFVRRRVGAGTAGVSMADGDRLDENRRGKSQSKRESNVADHEMLPKRPNRRPILMPGFAGPDHARLSRRARSDRVWRYRGRDRHL